MNCKNGQMFGYFKLCWFLLAQWFLDSEFSYKRCYVFAVVRTLTGHKSNIRCLDFHPYGDFVASGSLDTNIKVCIVAGFPLSKL